MLSLLLFFSIVYCQEAPVVHLSQGPVQGLKVISDVTFVTYYSFKGIPYAEPPVGELRFKSPKPRQPWSGVWDATEDRNACMQPAERPYPPFTIAKSEDCLYLNVYTPSINVTRSRLLPVMVYIHGGGFFKLSSDSRIYGPDFLLQEDIILVTIQYRLGIFGFLNLELPGAQGNAGLKDQLLALKWVKNEITSFGGNPDCVTIFGNSAGGMSVHFLYLSPLSTGLFHRAITQSGPAYKIKEIAQSNYQEASKLAKQLNCSTVKAEAVLECLKSAKPEDIIRVQEYLTNMNAPGNFFPTIEKDLGEELLLPESIAELNRRGYNTASYMMGANRNEGIYFVSYRNYLKDMQNLNKFLPPAIRNCSELVINKTVDKLETFYLKNDGQKITNVTNFNLKGAIDLYTDDNYLYGTILAVRDIRPRAKMYLYQFSFDGGIKFIPPASFLKEYNISGASHTDEVGYLFRSKNLNQNTSLLTDDGLTISRMLRLWTNFAKFGDPTPATDTSLEVKWTPVSETEIKHLRIGKDLTMIDSVIEPERIEFLDNLYSNAATCQV